MSSLKELINTAVKNYLATVRLSDIQTGELFLKNFLILSTIFIVVSKIDIIIDITLNFNL